MQKGGLLADFYPLQSALPRYLRAILRLVFI